MCCGTRANLLATMPIASHTGVPGYIMPVVTLSSSLLIHMEKQQWMAQVTNKEVPVEVLGPVTMLRRCGDWPSGWKILLLSIYHKQTNVLKAKIYSFKNH